MPSGRWVECQKGYRFHYDSQKHANLCPILPQQRPYGIPGTLCIKNPTIGGQPGQFRGMRRVMVHPAPALLVALTAPPMAVMYRDVDCDLANGRRPTELDAVFDQVDQPWQACAFRAYEAVIVLLPGGVPRNALFQHFNAHVDVGEGRLSFHR